MSIQNLIINGSFETGKLTPWSSANTTVTSQFSHSGSFSARFQSSPFTSFIGQFVPLNPGERMEVLASFAKVGTAPSTPVFIQVTFYDSLSNFLGAGLGTTIPVDHIPTADNDTWLEIYQTTTPAPPNTTQAFILIYTSLQAGTANVLVDDVALLIAPTGGIDFAVLDARYEQRSQLCSDIQGCTIDADTLMGISLSGLDARYVLRSDLCSEVANCPNLISMLQELNNRISALEGN